MLSRKLMAFGIAYGVSLSGMAFAETLTSDFNVLMVVKPKCSLTETTIGDINLAEHEAGAANIKGSTQFAVLCTKTTPYAISLTPSNASSSGQGTLRGANQANTETISYSLYKDAAMSEVWGNQADPGGNQQAGTGNPDGTTSVNHTVYAKVPVLGNLFPDTYKDRVTVTITY